MSAWLYHIVSWVSKYELKFWYLKVCFTEMSNISGVMSSCLAGEPVPVLFSVWFFSFFFLGEPGGQPADRQGCREVFSSCTWVRETDGACQTVVCGFIQIYDGRKWGWLWTMGVGGIVEAEGPAFCAGFWKTGSLWIWGGPSTAVLFELIVFYFSTLLSVLLFCCLLRRAPLPSHWTPLHLSLDSELSLRLPDWHLLRCL